MKITGIQHICLEAQGVEAYEKTVDFYHRILGLPVALKWGEGEKIGTMLDTGAGWLEIFAKGKDKPTQGPLRHMALAVDDPDAFIEAVRAEGYEVTMEPKDIEFATTPPTPARIAFCIGPVGEEVEFFKLK